MAVGEAHWQYGIVERHIGTVRQLLNKLMLEDTFEGAETQAVVDQTCEATHRNGSHNVTSPSQLFLGRSRNPLIDTSEVAPMLTNKDLRLKITWPEGPLQPNNFMPQMPKQFAHGI